MRNVSPVTIAFIASIVISVSCPIIIGILCYLLSIDCNPLTILLFVIASFFISFFTFLFFIQKWIYKRIKDTLITIRAYKNSDKKIYSKEFSKDILSEMDDELLSWSEERKKEIERLKKVEAYRKEFLGNVSHELKTPIFNIQGYVLTLLSGGLEDPNVNKKYLERAEKSVNRMIGIVEDLEAISQLETGGLLLEYGRFNIVATIKDVFEALEIKAMGKGIMLTMENKDQKPVYVYADQFRIRQVLSNLIENSIKYGKEYGETIVKLHELGGNLHVEVADNGIGIAQEHISRLFERFYRVDKSRSREQGGTGLGLSIVKHIIEAHNQKVSLTSTEGEGSVFSFTLKKALD